MKPPVVMNVIFYGLIAVSVTVVAFGIFRSQENVANPRADSARQVAAASPLVASEPFFDFGNISMAAGKVSRRHTIRNTAASPVTITRVYTSCMCTDATLITPSGRKGPFGMPGHGPLPSISESVPPGGTVLVDVVFDPAAHGPAGIGLTERIVTIRTGASQLDLRFRANVRP
jgi:hypothetical protein